MINIEAELYDKVESEILKWNEEGIYAISFLVDSNEAYEYRGFENASMWTISYNTESDCDGAGLYDEERWNYALWRQDEIPIISLEESDIYSEMLFDWYEENGITNIGEEDSDEDYDEDGRYIGKGPVGHYELLEIASNVGRKLQEEGVIEDHFGKPLPIIVHGLEYAWYDVEATENANQGGEADVFREAMERNGFV